MSKNFKNSPFDKFNNIESERQLVTTEDVNVKLIKSDKEPRKVGRPKTKQGEFKTINVAVPVEILKIFSIIQSILSVFILSYSK